MKHIGLMVLGLVTIGQMATAQTETPVKCPITTKVAIQQILNNKLLKGDQKQINLMTAALDSKNGVTAEGPDYCMAIDSTTMTASLIIQGKLYNLLIENGQVTSASL